MKSIINYTNRARIIPILFFLIMICNSRFTVHAQNSGWLWAKKAANGIESECPHSIVIDNFGNSYITGYFIGTTVKFGNYTLTNDTNEMIFDHSDIFIAKYDVNGDVVWATSAGGDKTDDPYSMAIDSLGYIYIVGRFQSTQLNIGPFTLNNTTIDNKSDIFLAKYDNNGNVIWAKSVSGSHSEECFGIDLDTSGNIFITGYFYGSSITFDNITLNNKSEWSDVFIAKYDNSGNVIWAKSAGGINSDVGFGISVDVSGNSFITGSFSKICTFDSINLINNNGDSDFFIAKYDVNGNVLWARNSNENGGNESRKVAVDATGNSFILGNFNDDLFILGNDSLQNSGGSILYSSDIFIAKYDPFGNLLWAKGIYGYESEKITGIAIDTAGSIYVSGLFYSNPLKFDTITLTGNFVRNIFLAKYNTSGNVIWASSPTGRGDDSEDVLAIAVDNSENCFFTGNFDDHTMSFGNIILTNEYTGMQNDKYDFFISKYHHPLNAMISPNGPTSFCTGDSVILYANTGKNYTYQWQKNGIDLIGAMDTFLIVDQSGNYSVLIKNIYGDTASAEQEIIVGSSLSASVIISVDHTDAICPGDNVLFSATPLNGGFPSYQWMLNGTDIIGAVNQTYNTDSLLDGDVIICRMYSSLSCSIGSPAISNAISMRVNPILMPSVTISVESSDTICAKEVVTFTATAINGGSSPTYRWLRSGTVITGETNSTYLSSSIPNGAVYTCGMVSNATCASPIYVTSNAIKMTVKPLPQTPSSIKISSGYLRSSSATNNQWLKNGIFIPGATDQFYLPTQDGYYTVVLIINGCTSLLSNGHYITINGINEAVEGIDFSIYPNPSNENFIIENSDLFISGIISIYDFQGQLILNETISKEKNQINISHLSKGMYFITMKTDTRIFTSKFIKE